MLKERMNKIVSISYDILRNKIISGGIIVPNEASFQLHFGVILKQVGQLFEFSDKDYFTIELETPQEIDSSVKTPNGKARCDISLSLSNADDSVSAVIELKHFKKKRADGKNKPTTTNRFSIMKDIENLEKYQVNEPNMLCYEILYTDDKAYSNENTTATIKLVGKITQNHTYLGETVNLKHDNKTEWICEGNHHFMMIRF